MRKKAGLRWKDRKKKGRDPGWRLSKLLEEPSKVVMSAAYAAYGSLAQKLSFEATSQGKISISHSLKSDSEREGQSGCQHPHTA